MRFLHTADWQIGRVFRFVDEATQGRLESARLDAISTLGRVARDQGALAVVVAGDVFDGSGVSDRTLAQVVERMRPFDDVGWHLLPGNHDPDVIGGPFQRLLRAGPPANIHLHLNAAPVAMGAEVWLLPAPFRSGADDPTAWMDTAPTPPGAIRLGLAHGSITGFGTERPEDGVIRPDRPERARLDYLALGDWHGFRKVGPRLCYAGTPEPDRFDQPDAGFSVLVEIEAHGSLPSITPVPTATFTWRREQATLHGADDIDRLDQHLRGLHPDLARLLLDLEVEGVLGLADRADFDRRIGESLAAAVCFLRIDDTRLLTRPEDDDVEAIAAEGILRTAALALKAISSDPAHVDQELAARALVRLRLEVERLGRG